MFIRPTNTDGYGVSVAEAISLGNPSIASHVCTGPEGTICFAKRDIDDLYNKTVDVIQNYKKHKENIANITLDDNSEKIINLYRELLTK